MKDFYNTLQTTIKKHIIDNYGNYLSNDMKNLLMEKNYINDLTLKISNLNEVFNHLVYKMLCDLLDKHYYTKYNIDENDEIYVPCAERFKEALVNYYIIDLSKKVKYSPIIDKSLAYIFVIGLYLNRKKAEAGIERTNRIKLDEIRKKIEEDKNKEE